MSKPKSDAARLRAFCVQARALEEAAMELDADGVGGPQTIRWATSASNIKYAALTASKASERAAAAREADRRCAAGAAKVAPRPRGPKVHSEAHVSSTQGAAQGAGSQRATGYMHPGVTNRRMLPDVSKIAQIDVGSLREECANYEVAYFLGLSVALQLLDSGDPFPGKNLETTSAILAAYCGYHDECLDVHGVPCVSPPHARDGPIDVPTLFERAWDWIGAAAQAPRGHDEDDDDDDATMAHADSGHSDGAGDSYGAAAPLVPAAHGVLHGGLHGGVFGTLPPCTSPHLSVPHVRGRSPTARPEHAVEDTSGAGSGAKTTFRAAALGGGVNSSIPASSLPG